VSAELLESLYFVQAQLRSVYRDTGDIRASEGGRADGHLAHWIERMGGCEKGRDVRCHKCPGCLMYNPGLPRTAREEEAFQALRALRNPDGTYCDHAAEPCHRCQLADRALGQLMSPVRENHDEETKP